MSATFHPTKKLSATFHPSEKKKCRSLSIPKLFGKLSVGQLKGSPSWSLLARPNISKLQTLITRRSAGFEVHKIIKYANIEALKLVKGQVKDVSIQKLGQIVFSIILPGEVEQVEVGLLVDDLEDLVGRGHDPKGKDLERENAGEEEEHDRDQHGHHLPAAPIHRRALGHNLRRKSSWIYIYLIGTYLLWIKVRRHGIKSVPH